MAHDDWAKMDARLDSHPKIRRGGREAREVFLFALRRNRLRHGGAADGRLPAADFEPWYLADQLMMPEPDAERGVARALAAGLLSRDGDDVVICGFDEDWGGRAPLTPAEKQKRFREREKARKVEPGPLPLPTVTDHGNGVTERVTPTNESNALPRSEEIRREEIPDRERARAGEGGAAPPGIVPGIDLHRDWTLALRRRRIRLELDLRAEGIGANLPPPSLVVDARVEVQALHLVQRWVSVAMEQGADPGAVIRERGDHLLAVLAAQARTRRDLSGLREETCWTPAVVGWAEKVTPADAAEAPDRRQRSRTAPRAAGAIGAAKARNDHGLGAKPFGEA
jgi:hypothetical protein